MIFNLVNQIQQKEREVQQLARVASPQAHERLGAVQQAAINGLNHLDFFFLFSFIKLWNFLVIHFSNALAWNLIVPKKIILNKLYKLNF